MLAQRKNDRREAISKSPRRYGWPAGAPDGAGSLWILRRKSGSTSIRSRANWIPLSKLPPSRRPLSKNAWSVRRSAFVSGRRYARRPIRPRILSAHPRSASSGSVTTEVARAAFFGGWHTKIARRLGVLATNPVAEYGPAIWTEPTL